MVQETITRRLSPPWRGLILLWTSFIGAYFFGLQGWALPFLPAFLLVLREEESLPYFSLLGILLLQDVAWGYWLGTHMFLYAGVGLLLRLNKRFILRRGFFLIWATFVFAIYSLVALRYGVGALTVQGSYPFLKFLYEGAFLSCLFPLFFHFLSEGPTVLTKGPAHGA